MNRAKLSWMLGFLFLSLPLQAQGLRQSERFTPPGASSSETPAHSTRFLALSGKLQPGQSADALLETIEKIFYAPLRENGVGRFTYLEQVMGDRFFMNFAAEPKDAASAPAFEDYVAKLEHEGFQGISVSFGRVDSLLEQANFLAGHYDSTQDDDPFVQNFVLPRNFIFHSLAQWEEFTDGYGYAFLSKDHQHFEDYLAQFVGDPAEFEQVRSVMKSDDMIAIDPHVTLLLDDQTVVGPEFEHTAFVPFRFFRNCFQANYEHGPCEGHSSN